MALTGFEGKVAIVTGAGGGLGRCHALELGRRGAKVVVNDLGGNTDGTGGSMTMAETVVQEIRAAGGTAEANGCSVTDQAGVQAMVQDALSRWGSVDILINNAGILRDKSFGKVTLDDFRAVVEVHLMGSVTCTKAVWDPMREAGYGRILMTSSSSGLYGNFGQANYGAAKMGVIGLVNVLKLEGAKYDVKVNGLAPVAGTRMTEDLMPEQAMQIFAPEYVTPAAVYLVSAEAPTGAVLSAGGGVVARTMVHETMGVNLGTGDGLTAEAVHDRYDAISSMKDARLPLQGADQGAKIHELLARDAG